MTDDPGRMHRGARLYAEECRRGLLDRREFLTRATALGVTATAAYGLIGAAAPAARAATPTRGGTLRIQMETKVIKDPRLWDWTEMANFCRGWLEYLAQYNPDGTVTPVLLESWEVNDDVTEYTLKLRPGITWNNGDPFTAADVAFNVERWCDAGVEGNSMASRLASLVDPETKKMRAGSVEIVDDLTLKIRTEAPDISLLVGMSDYPSAVVHPSYEAGSNPVDNPVGTGAYLPVVNDVGDLQVLERNPDHTYWREDAAWLDRIEFIDTGTDAATVVAAAESGEINMTFKTDFNTIDQLDAVGWELSEAVTASTIAVRFNQLAAPYDNREVRRALQLCCDNRLVLGIGIGGRGTVAENHHVCPIHPEYAELPPLEVDGAKAKAMLEAAGHGETEFELISIDTEWQAATCDGIVAQLRQAGIAAKRTIIPGATFWNDWTKYPWSATEWIMRPLGVQVLALAYKSGVPWNESAFSNAEFDAELERALSIADADERRVVMKRLQEIMQEEGVMIQPYWQSYYRHTDGTVGNADMHPLLELRPHDYYMM